MAYGFQYSAFQNTGFQSYIAMIGGGGYDTKTKAKKNKFVVRKDGKLLVFSNEADAIAAVNYKEPELAQAVTKKKTKKAAKATTQIVLAPPKPVEQVDLQAIVDLSTQYAAKQEYEFLLKAQEYEAMLNLYRKYRQREEEEIISLLLAA